MSIRVAFVSSSVFRTATAEKKACTELVEVYREPCQAIAFPLSVRVFFRGAIAERKKYRERFGSGEIVFCRPRVSIHFPPTSENTRPDSCLSPVSSSDLDCLQGKINSIENLVSSSVFRTATAERKKYREPCQFE